MTERTRGEWDDEVRRESILKRYMISQFPESRASCRFPHGHQLTYIPNYLFFERYLARAARISHPGAHFF
jgi:hypothetical protein